ncbi:MAG: hypothetical protein HXS51_11090 [Theionarchaea archaeon]|nr:hypothetical protein [Theionarchaea archaeon]
MDSRVTAVLIFFMFFLAGYVTIGYARHHIYETEINEIISEFEGYREKGIERPMAWDIYTYHGDPRAIPIIEDPVYKELAYSLWDIHQDYNYEYQIEVVPQILEKTTSGKWNLWNAYQRAAVYRELQLVAYIGTNSGIDLGPDLSTDFCGALAESVADWEAAGGERNGDWFKDYEQSPEYETLMDQWFAKISGPKEIELPPPPIDNVDQLISNALEEGKSEDDPYIKALYIAKEYYDNQYEIDVENAKLHKPMSIEKRHTAATQELEIPFWTDIFIGKTLRAEQKLIEIAYDRYLVHLDQEDLVRTGVDAGVIEFSGDYLDRRAQKGFDLSFYLKIGRFPFRTLIIDTLVLITSSFVLTFLVMKKVMPVLKLRYSREE